MKRTIRLRGISGEVKGKTWESSSLLRAGRLASLEIVLDEGRNRHIRRLLEVHGVGVLRLIRIAIGPKTPAEAANRIDTLGRRRGALICRIIGAGACPSAVVRRGGDSA